MRGVCVEIRLSLITFGTWRNSFSLLTDFNPFVTGALNETQLMRFSRGYSQSAGLSSDTITLYFHSYIINTFHQHQPPTFQTTSGNVPMHF